MKLTQHGTEVVPWIGSVGCQHIIRQIETALLEAGYDLPAHQEAAEDEEGQDSLLAQSGHAK